MHTQKIRQKQAKRQNCGILHDRKRSGITQQLPSNYPADIQHGASWAAHCSSKRMNKPITKILKTHFKNIYAFIPFSTPHSPVQLTWSRWRWWRWCRRCKAGWWWQPWRPAPPMGRPSTRCRTWWSWCGWWRSGRMANGCCQPLCWGFRQLLRWSYSDGPQTGCCGQNDRLSVHSVIPFWQTNGQDVVIDARFHHNKAVIPFWWSMDKMLYNGFSVHVNSKMVSQYMLQTGQWFFSTCCKQYNGFSVHAVNSTNGFSVHAVNSTMVSQYTLQTVKWFLSTCCKQYNGFSVYAANSTMVSQYMLWTVQWFLSTCCHSVVMVHGHAVLSCCE